ncbi:MAG: GtrA family protein [Bacilli bacterium]
MRFVQFALVGVLNTMVDFGMFVVLQSIFHMNLYTANAIAYMLAVVNSFLMNKYWTFSDHATSRLILQDFGLFTIGNVVGLTISTLIIYASTFFMPSVLGKVLAIAVVFPWNYWFSRRFVYILSV